MIEEKPNIGGLKHSIDAKKAVAILKALVPAMIVERTGRGVGADGKAFAPYSAAYRQALLEAGEKADPVDLRLTGGMLASVKARKVEVTKEKVSVWFAPDAGTSPAVSLQDGKAKRTGKRGPPHNVVAHWLHYGTPKMRARPWLDLTKEERAELLVEIAKALVKTSVTIR